MKGRVFDRLAVALVAGAFTIAAATAADAKLRRITIGTNPAGTMYNTLGNGFAKLFSEKLGVPSTAQPHAGSSVYIPLLDNGEITLGLNSSLDSSMSYNGMKPYPKAMKNLRALTRIWELPYSYVVKANSGITKIEDLRGKKVIVDLKANVSLAALNWAIMATGGLGKNDIQAIAVGGIRPGFDALTEGRAVAAPTALGIGLLRKAHAGIPGGVRIINLGAKATDAFMGSRVGGSRTLISQPSKRNVAVVGPTKVVAFDTFINVGTKTSADDAYAMLKTLHENWTSLQKDYPVLRGVKADKMAPATNPHPYHAGAVRYYKEVGMWTAANEKQQQSVK